MRFVTLTLIAISFVLAACDTEEDPKLDAHGHWIVQHEYSDFCQVGATFTDELFILTFHSIVEGACTPEAYGIENNTLALNIDHREDYENGSGEVAADFSVSLTQLGVAGHFTLTESASGLSGRITDASDPEGLLQWFVDTDFPLTPVSESWFPLIKGRWNPDCSELIVSDTDEDVCGYVEFIDVTSGRVFMPLDPVTGPDESAPLSSSSDDWLEFTYAMRNIVETDEAGYVAEITILVTDPKLEYEPGIIPSAQLTVEIDSAGTLLKFMIEDEVLELSRFED